MTDWYDDRERNRRRGMRGQSDWDEDRGNYGRNQMRDYDRESSRGYYDDDDYTSDSGRGYYDYNPGYGRGRQDWDYDSEYNPRFHQGIYSSYDYDNRYRPNRGRGSYDSGQYRSGRDYSGGYGRGSSGRGLYGSNYGGYGSSYGGSGQTGHGGFRGRGYPFGEYGRGGYRPGYGEDFERDTEMDFDNDFYEDSDYQPTYWSYTEYWLIPGPYSGLGPQGYQRSDERIHEDVCERLTQHGQIDASDVEVEVKNGEVHLRGVVDSRQAKRMTEDTVEAISGVREVHNELRVRKGLEQRETQTRSAGEHEKQTQGQMQTQRQGQMTTRPESGQTDVSGRGGQGNPS